MTTYARRYQRTLLAAILSLGLLGFKATGYAAMEPMGGIALDQPSAQLGGYAKFAVVFSPQRLDSGKKGGVRVQVRCYQGSDLVFETADHYDRPILLGGGSSRWLEAGGPASCKADLFYEGSRAGQKFNLLASTAFEAAGL